MTSSASRKRTRSNQSITSPQSISSVTPKPKRHNFQIKETMAGRRPPIIRATNEDLLKDVCTLTQLVEHQRLDKTRHGNIYIPEIKQCHNVNKAKGNTKLEYFRANFDWNKVGNTVKDSLGGDLSTVVMRHKIKIVDSMITDLASTCN